MGLAPARQDRQIRQPSRRYGYGRRPSYRAGALFFQHPPDSPLSDLAPGPRWRPVKLLTQIRPAVWLLFVAALLLRAGIPIGWMPVAGDDGLRIMLCSGTGPVEIAVEPGAAHHNHHHQQQGHGEGGHDPCPYGLALGKSLDLALSPATLLPPETIAALSAPMLATAWSAARRSLRPPVRGPPAFA